MQYGTWIFRRQFAPGSQCRAGRPRLALDHEPRRGTDKPTQDVETNHVRPCRLRPTACSRPPRHVAKRQHGMCGRTRFGSPANSVLFGVVLFPEARKRPWIHVHGAANRVLSIVISDPTSTAGPSCASGGQSCDCRGWLVSLYGGMPGVWISLSARPQQLHSEASRSTVARSSGDDPCVGPPVSLSQRRLCPQDLRRTSRRCTRF